MGVVTDPAYVVYSVRSRGTRSMMRTTDINSVGTAVYRSNGRFGIAGRSQQLEGARFSVGLAHLFFVFLTE